MAGFIGMPPMNFFDGVLKLEDGRLMFEEGKGSRKPGKTGGGHVEELTLPGDGFRLAIPRHLSESLGGWVGRHVVLGIRPEHFTLKPPSTVVGGEGTGAEFAPIRVTLNVIEPLGSDMDVYMSTALSETIVGRVEAQPGLQRDAQVTMYVDLRKVHVFEPGETGMNLSSKTSEPAHALA